MDTLTTSILVTVVLGLAFRLLFPTPTQAPQIIYIQTEAPQRTYGGGCILFLLAVMGMILLLLLFMIIL